PLPGPGAVRPPMSLSGPIVCALCPRIAPTPPTLPGRRPARQVLAVVRIEGDSMKQFTTPPQHESRPDENTTDLLLGRLRSNPSVPIFEIAQDDGSFSPVSTADFIEEVKRVAKGLIAAGIDSGDVVAILSRTRYEWALADWAVWWARSEEHTSELQSRFDLVCRLLL